MAKRRAVSKKPVIDSRNPATWGPATPETRSRLRRCSVKALFERGHLGVEELRAAHEIERVYVMLTAGLFAKTASPELRGRISGGRRVDMAEAAVAAFSGRYRPWADRLSAQHKSGGPPMLEVVIDCVIDGHTVGDIDKARRWRHGKAAGYLREGLSLYAEMAGWRRRAA